jgi:hypothetical protein
MHKFETVDLNCVLVSHLEKTDIFLLFKVFWSLLKPRQNLIIINLNELFVNAQSAMDEVGIIGP